MFSLCPSPPFLLPPTSPLQLNVLPEQLPPLPDWLFPPSMLGATFTPTASAAPTCGWGCPPDILATSGNVPYSVAAAGGGHATPPPPATPPPQPPTPPAPPPSSNKKARLVGIGVGLGAPLVAVIVGAVYALRKHQRRAALARAIAAQRAREAAEAEAEADMEEARSAGGTPGGSAGNEITPGGGMWHGVPRTTADTFPLIGPSRRSTRTVPARAPVTHANPLYEPGAEEDSQDGEGERGGEAMGSRGAADVAESALGGVPDGGRLSAVDLARGGADDVAREAQGLLRGWLPQAQAATLRGGAAGVGMGGMEGEGATDDERQGLLPRSQLPSHG